MAGFGWPPRVNNDAEVWYRMKLFLNPNALPVVRLPNDFAAAFNGRILA